MSKRQEQCMEVGVAFEMALRYRSYHQESLARYGLYEAWSMLMDSRYRTTLNPLRAIDGYTTPNQLPVRGRAEPFRRRHDFVRAIFAYLMAAMTDAERDSIVEGL